MEERQSGFLGRNAQQVEEMKREILLWSQRMREWNLPWKTGIFPSEMAVFLGMCSVAKIRGIVDSGRGPHAYSTHVLGEFANATGAQILSLDFASPDTKGYGDSLRRYTRVRCMDGDAFELLPAEMPALPAPVALLVDGPKTFTANRLSLVLSVVWDVPIVAHHNCPPDEGWTRQFKTLFPGAFHMEDLGLEREGAWVEFREWERRLTGGKGPGAEIPGARGRSLEASSLVVGRGDVNRGQVGRVLKGGLRAWWLWRKWRQRGV